MKAYCFECDKDVPCVISIKDMTINDNDLKGCPFGYSNKHKWMVVKKTKQPTRQIPSGYFRKRLVDNEK